MNPEPESNAPEWQPVADFHDGDAVMSKTGVLHELPCWRLAKAKGKYLRYDPTLAYAEQCVAAGVRPWPGPDPQCPSCRPVPEAQPEPEVTPEPEPEKPTRRPRKASGTTGDALPSPSVIGKAAEAAATASRRRESKAATRRRVDAVI